MRVSEREEVCRGSCRLRVILPLDLLRTFCNHRVSNPEPPIGQATVLTQELNLTVPSKS